MKRIVFAAVACCVFAGSEADGQVWTDEPQRAETEWKAPEATKEDYAESDRYWHEQKKKLDRLDVDLKFVDGREILVPRHRKQPVARKGRIEIPAAKGSIESIVVKPDGTIVITFRGRP